MSNVSASFLSSTGGVILALVTYTDWWQPASGCVMQVGSAKRAQSASDGLPSGLIGTLDVRTELSRRMQRLTERERTLLFYWYVQQIPVAEVASALRISRRQCFRHRGSAIRKLVELGDEQAA